MNAPLPHKQTLIQRIVDRFGVDEEKLWSTLKATAFKQKSNEPPVTDEQMIALLIVADQYKLNPFTKELYAYPDKQNGIVPVVSVDGWARIINEHPMMDGLEFNYSTDIETYADAKPCPKWAESVIYRKDRSKPTKITEHLDEVYRKPFARNDGSKHLGPWQTHTKRFLRHKALIQGARIAFGFAGIYDDDEAQRILERDVTAEGQTLGAAPVVEMPRAISDARNEPPPIVGMHQAQRPRETVDRETGEIRPTYAPAEATGDNTQTNAAGSGADQQMPMTSGQKKILAAKLKNAGLNEVDLEAKFGKRFDAEGWLFADFETVQAWIKERSAGAQAQ